MNFYTIRVAIRNGISGTPCWILYVHSQIYSYTFTYHQQQNKTKSVTESELEKQLAISPLS